jgi:hypothetical protein
VGFVVDKAALGQVFSEYFGFPCQSFHRSLHYHNHPGLTQKAIKWPQCRVDLIPPPTMHIKKKRVQVCTSRSIHIFQTQFYVFLPHWPFCSFTAGKDVLMYSQPHEDTTEYGDRPYFSSCFVLCL